MKKRETRTAFHYGVQSNVIQITHHLRAIAYAYEQVNS